MTQPKTIALSAPVGFRVDPPLPPSVLTAPA
jgi:hypothetical protein